MVLSLEYEPALNEKRGLTLEALNSGEPVYHNRAGPFSFYPQVYVSHPDTARGRRTKEELVIVKPGETIARDVKLPMRRWDNLSDLWYCITGSEKFVHPTETLETYHEPQEIERHAAYTGFQIISRGNEHFVYYE